MHCESKLSCPKQYNTMSPLPGLELGKLDPEPSAITMKYPLHPGGGGGGATPTKIGWGCAARFPKPLPYL